MTFYSLQVKLPPVYPLRNPIRFSRPGNWTQPTSQTKFSDGKADARTSTPTRRHVT